MKRALLIPVLFILIYKPVISQLKYAYVHYDSIYVSHPKLEIFEDSIARTFYHYDGLKSKFCYQLDSLEKTNRARLSQKEKEFYETKRRALIDTLNHLGDQTVAQTFGLINTLIPMLEREVDSACVAVEKQEGINLLKLNDSLIALETRTNIDMTYKVITYLNSRYGHQKSKNRHHRNGSRDITFLPMDCPAEYNDK